MTHTIRIYNRRIKKAHRINLLNLILDFKEQVETGEINNPLRNSVHHYGFVLGLTFIFLIAATIMNRVIDRYGN